MLKFILKRLLTIVIVLFFVATLTYFAVHVTPGDMLYALVVQTYGEEYVSDEVMAKVAKRFDLDQPVWKQYLGWLDNIFHLDFGTSYVYHMPVIELIRIRLPNTLRTGGLAFLISAVLGIPLGIWCAVKQNGFLDHLTRLVTLAFSSFPGFWMALVLIIIFALKLGWLPTSGNQTPQSIILPSLTLSLGMLASTARIMRTSMLDVLRQDYMITAESKGITPGRKFSAHALRNAIPSVITVLGLQIGHIVGGSVLIESVFSWPGIGGLLSSAISSKDLPMIEGCVIIITFSYAFVNLLVDILYAAIDPRVRYSEG